jgi:hypothetical protein
MRFAKFLEGVEGIEAGKVYSESEIHLVRDELESGSARVLESVPYMESSTFTGVCVLKSEKGPMGILFHSGDSFLLECDLERGQVRSCTRNDFLMIGRTRSFSQVEVVDMTRSKRYLLGTDGFSCLELPDRKEDFLLALFRTQNVEAVADILVDQFGNGAGDDIALLGFDPAGLLLYPASRARLVMGGTNSREEEKIQSLFLSGSCLDRYEPYGGSSLEGFEGLR